MRLFFLLLIQYIIGMKEGLSKQKKYMSSKELYFLPMIKQVKWSSKPSLSDQKLPTYKYKSIEQIIEKKDKNNSKIDKYDSFTLADREQKIAINLYNKYESLPKIYMYRNRKQDYKLEDQPSKTLLKKHLKSQDNEQTKIEDEGSYLKNKQNSFNFNDFFYKQHFNKRLLEETDKIEFKLSYNYSEKEFLGDEVFRDETNLSERKKKPVKYTKIQMNQKEIQEEVRTLERVPDFLMKILEPPKPVTSA